MSTIYRPLQYYIHICKQMTDPVIREQALGYLIARQAASPQIGVSIGKVNNTLTYFREAMHRSIIPPAEKTRFLRTLSEEDRLILQQPLTWR